MRAVEDRKQIEASTWDSLHTRSSSPRSAIYRAAKISRLYTESWIQSNAPGKTFLDLCCGNGAFTNLAAQCGAKESIGIDISHASVEIARSTKVAGSRFIEGDCENTGLPNSSVGVALCASSIQHLALEPFLLELRRILVPGGRCLIVSSLAYNPAIALYRKLTPQMRTEWSQNNLLTGKKIGMAGKFLIVENVRYWHITSLAAIPFPWLLSITNRVDALLTRLWPINRLSWMISFELIKSPPNESPAN